MNVSVGARKVNRTLKFFRDFIFDFDRVDFFLDEATDTVIINEVNTMPGFTPISMYPQMWAAAGMSYPDLLSELLTEASQRPLGLR